MKKALFYGILSSFFFAFTFILNRSMNLAGGYWLWSSPLRYLIALPLMTLVLIITDKKKIFEVLQIIRKDLTTWMIWSTIGFGFFYLPLTLGSVFGESWFTAASWEITIVSGVLLTPLFGKKIPVKNLMLSILIVIGVFIMQFDKIINTKSLSNFTALIPILIASFAYPLGNRKMMSNCPENIDTIQRVWGMLFCSAPFWIIVAFIAAATGGMPSEGQIIQSFGVAIFSGVIATLLFFHATDIVKDNPKHLAIIEATQCGEVVFTLLGGILVLGDSVPGFFGIIGLFLIIIGMILNSIYSE